MTEDEKAYFSTRVGDQRSLTGDSVEEQAAFTVDKGVRVEQGRDARVESEVSEGGLAADTRDDPSRGPENEPDESTQYTLGGHAVRDKAQTGLEAALPDDEDRDVNVPGL